MPIPLSEMVIPLSADQIRSYHEQGFLIIRDVIARGAIADAAAEIARLAERTDLIDVNNIRCRFWKQVDSDDCRFDCFDPIIDLSSRSRALAHDPRILGIASALYGEPACLLKDKLIFKPPGAQGYALHQDYIAWPSFPTSFLTIIVAIDPCHAENGATEVFPGFHHQGYLSPRDGQYHELPVDAVAQGKGVVLELQPGDIAVLSGYTPHRSAPNRSASTRRQLYVSYNAISDGGEQRRAHYDEFHLWLKDKYAEHGKTNTYFR